MAAHAKLSPSGSKRWFACPGSLVLEAPIPNKHNDYSDDGTAMHEVAAWCLTEHYRAAKRIGERIAVHYGTEEPRYVEFTEDMADLVQGYVDTVRKIGIGCRMLVEQQVDFSEYLDPAVLELLGPQFGTLDCGIVDDRQHELGIYDLKSGYTPVLVDDNSQLKTYALGLLRKLLDEDLVTDYTDPIRYAAEVLGIRTIRLGIYQPKVYSQGLVETVITIDDLAEFAETLRQKASTVRGAHESHGKMPQAEWERIYLHPSPNEADCAFCRAMATCPAARRKVESTIGDFPIVKEEDLHVIDSSTDTDLLNDLMLTAPFAEDFFKAVRAEVERRLLLGLEMPDYGLELGRQGPRKWRDLEAAEEMIRDRFKISIKDACNLKLKSPTQLEELTKAPEGGKPILGPTRWKKLQAEIVRSDPRPSVKPKTVIKKPYTVPTPDASDFPDEDQLW